MKTKAFIVRVFAAKIWIIHRWCLGQFHFSQKDLFVFFWEGKKLLTVWVMKIRERLCFTCVSSQSSSKSSTQFTRRSRMKNCNQWMIMHKVSGQLLSIMLAIFMVFYSFSVSTLLRWYIFLGKLHQYEISFSFWIFNFLKELIS